MDVSPKVNLEATLQSLQHRILDVRSCPSALGLTLDELSRYYYGGLLPRALTR